VIAQVRPGQSVGFQKVSLNEAQDLYCQAVASFQQLRQGIAVHLQEWLRA